MAARSGRLARFGVLVAAVAAGLGLSACGGSTGVEPRSEMAGQQPVTRPARIIVNFRDPPEQVNTAFLQALERQAGSELRFLRQLSGGACVFEIDGANAERIMRRLADRPDVIAVEPDRKLRHQRQWGGAIK